MEKIGNLKWKCCCNFLKQTLLYGNVLIKKNYLFRASAEEAIRVLNGTQLGGQSVRLSWGRSPANKQVSFASN